VRDGAGEGEDTSADDAAHPDRGELAQPQGARCNPPLSGLSSI
jgi:hypothetical protein